jgi:putative transposase
MMRSISIPVPEQLLAATGGAIEPLRIEFRRRLAVGLLNEGRLSRENAAAMAGVPVGEFLQSRDALCSQAGEPAIPLPASLPFQADKDWPHAPLHRISEYGNYIVTAGTYQKALLLDSPEKRTLLEGQLLSLAKQYGWQLEAWAVLANHYHFVASGTGLARDIKLLVKQLHSDVARDLNLLDGEPGRKVWHNYWDTKITFEKSYLARLNYVHQNPVKHGLVPVANRYPWCSAAWFERTARPSMVKTIYRFKIDRLRVPDDF